MTRLILMAAACVCTAVAHAQSYPSKPIRAVVTTPPGGGVDMVARVVARGLSPVFGQSVVVDNRGGANGVIGVDAVAKAPADGYTLLFVGNNFWILPFLKEGTPYSPTADFSAITLAVRSPNILVVHPSLPVKSVREFVSLARAKPGQLTYAAGSVGSTIHLAAELFKAMAKVNITYVPYKGAGPAMIDLMGGHVQMMFGLSVMNHVRAGRMKALGIATAAPSDLAPGIPTVASQGLPGFESAVMYSAMVRAGTPPAIIAKLNDEIVKVLRADDVKALMLQDGSEVVASTPAELAATVQSEMNRWGKIIRDNGIRAE
jgi:tripartite-type tricarboxylate transporter receptor subunit TctC